MDLEQLASFLVQATKQGYASGEGKMRVDEPDGSTSVTVKDGPWKSHDNYFGGEPYGGRIIVFYEGEPVWMMVYYGSVAEGVEDIESIYAMLMEALSQIPLEAPYRGPAEIVTGTMRYANSWSGSPEDYLGEEHIYNGETLVYSGWYRGGRVNVRKEA